MAANEAKTCEVCFDTFESGGEKIDGSDICDGCFQEGILSQFKEAVLHEQAWPVKWGAVVLAPEQFAPRLGDDFVERYNRRKAEYETPKIDRLHCHHQILSIVAPPVGSKALEGKAVALTSPKLERARNKGLEIEYCGTVIALRSEAASKKLSCYHCAGFTCGDCGKALSSRDQAHQCGELPPATDLSAEGLQRGRDYQECPDCHDAVSLADGCNHVACRCGIDFCYICGKEVHDGDGHWSLGMPCPRWNQPGSAGAMFDDEDDEDDDEPDTAGFLGLLAGQIPGLDSIVRPDTLALVTRLMVWIMVRHRRAIDDAFVDIVADALLPPALRSEVPRQFFEDEIAEAVPRFERERDRTLPAPQPDEWTGWVAGEQFTAGQQRDLATLIANVDMNVRAMAPEVEELQPTDPGQPHNHTVAAFLELHMEIVAARRRVPSAAINAWGWPLGLPQLDMYLASVPEWIWVLVDAEMEDEQDEEDDG